MAFDARPLWGSHPAFLRLYVGDCDAAYRRALGAGARSVTEPTEMPFGERVARVRDLHGNIWWIHVRFAELSPEEPQRRAKAKKYLDAMAYVQSSLDAAMSAR
jgi:PhnB protein